MSWTKFTCFFAICALLAAPVMADPSLSVDLVGGAAPTLSAGGGLQFTIGVDLDESLYEDYDDSPDRGRGGSGAIDVGFTLSGDTAPATFVGSTVNATNAPSTFGGNSVFGDETANWEGVEIGSDASNVAVSLGSEFFTSASTTDIVDVHELVQLELSKLTLDNNEVVLSWGGMYNSDGTDGGTTHGGIAQDNGAGSQFGTAGTLMYTATTGDANLTGGVTLSDLNAVLFNFGSGTTWNLGNFDGDAATDLSDLNAVLFNFGAASGVVSFSGAGAISAVSVPEPSSILLAGLVGVGLVGLRKFRA